MNLSELDQMDINTGNLHSLRNFTQNNFFAVILLICDSETVIDTIMGLDRAIFCDNNTGASVYDDRGILFI